MPTFTIQIPTYMGMAPLICSYCRRPGNHHTCSGDLEGIISCEDHQSLARRDCQAFLHQTGKVLLRDAMEHPDLKPFFDALPATFSTIRSNGATDEGWSIPDHLVACNGRICKSPAGEWALPIEKEAERIGRCASFQSFLTAKVPGITSELVAATLSVLDAGVYRAANDEQVCIAAATGVRPDTPEKVL
jgi:hypothetical protein